MNLLFGRTVPLQLRLTVAVVLSIILIIGDRYTVGGTMVRTSLNTLVSPLLYVANIPYEAFNLGLKSLNTREKLQQENQTLREKQLIQSEQLQQLQFLQKENQELRALLGASARETNQRLISQVLSVHSNPYSHQVVINRGTIDGISEGQAVIDEMGIVGQLTQVGTTTSRVLLMTDTTHATPVRILRNDVRTVVEGTGKINNVRLAHVPHSMDIRIGDVLVTSGLGGTFPEGYPVAVVTEIDRDEGLPFAQVQAEPIAQLDRIRLLVVLGKRSQEAINHE
ncbi:rod shape-determining protein MreC [Pseudoalteromonas sp. L23]|uniref:rod shape-determining protein MreC n=1 Tax=unclassified Pseudoalteromonas TaxID=194690 RepID=UPI001EF04DCA|nr:MULTISPECIES: rod shape-determining protein MreC [unclassified Pseudoalteromonas]MCF7513722.1 rod shape-determining protein MreC [Pseudoalteromonas sp. L7]MCF7525762.1 rod shape-determining protein MreC [Pseudoalteromonas sp. L23]MCX2766739.1 rod shape-determining protein MreC [Pseudoalteromonas sp. B530]